MDQTIFYLALFIGGGIVGWMLDTIYCSLFAKRYVSKTVLPFFSPAYGIGAVMLFALYEFTALSFFLYIIAGTVLCVMLELIIGVMLLSLFQRRVWDYSASPYNFRGFIDLEHTFCWLALTPVFWWFCTHIR